MTENKTVKIDTRKLFNLGANLITAGFFKQKPEAAKKLFKQLKQGEMVKGGQLSAESSGAAIPVMLELDRAEYRGQFNFPNFEVAVKALLQKFETEVRKDRELKQLNTLNNQETGGILFNIPSGVQIDEHINVLMMAVDPKADKLVVRLIFMPPEQFISQQ